MGQYHLIVNLDRREFIHPHKLGAGLKLWEQLASSPGTPAALIVLLASASNGDGGGDLGTGPTIIGQWRGDRIAMVGDYDDKQSYSAGKETNRRTLTGADIYCACTDTKMQGAAVWRDVSAEVCAVIETELEGTFQGDGLREFVTKAA